MINSSVVNNHGFDFDSDNQNGIDIDTASHRLFVADTNNNRVLVFNLANDNTLADFNADYVLGQADFVANGRNRGDNNLFISVVAPTANTLYRPSDVLFNADNGILYVADTFNNRITAYNLADGITSGEDAIKVLGQADFVSGSQNRGGNPGANTLFLPNSMAINKVNNTLYVGDKSNSRILAYNLADGITNGEDAIKVLGQNDFTSFNLDSIGPARLSGISDIAYGDSKLFVADYSYNRVLVFDVTDITNGEDAVHVLGQGDFSSNIADYNATFSFTNSAASLYNPNGILYNPNNKTLLVSNKGSNRVSVFDVLTIFNGENAVATLGQAEFSSFGWINGNAFSVPNQQGFYTPAALAIDPGTNLIYIVDSSNHRIVSVNLVNLSATVMPNGTIGFPYSKTLNPAVNNKGNINYGLISGTLPPGLNFNPNTRMISGTPTQAGSFTFTIQASDTFQNTAGQVEYYLDQEVFSITVVASNGPANLNVTKIETASKILAPNQSSIELGKWNVAAANGDVSLRKITLQAVNPNGGAAMVNFNSFSSLSLYDGATLLATANNVNSNVVFLGFNSIITNGTSKVYTLKGNTSASGVFSSNKTASFAVKSDSLADIDARNSAGVSLNSASINFSSVSNNGPAEFRFAVSNPNLYHDAFPVIVAQPINAGQSNSLVLSNVAKVFKFSVTNAGSRDLRLSGMNVLVGVSGLAQGGTISDFRLYKENAVGSMTQLAQYNTLINNLVNQATIPFNQTNDINNWLDILTIAPGATQTFFVTADTTNITTNLVSGNILRVSTKIVGEPGWNGNAWNTGNLFYLYTTANGAQLGPFSASDSYNVDGGDLVYTL